MKTSFAAFLLMAGLDAAGAQTPANFTLLYTFPSPSGGAAPSSINEVAPGLFYGSTAGNFTTIGSEIFSITSAGKFQNIVQLGGNRIVYFVTPTERGQLLGMVTLVNTNPHYFTVGLDGSNFQSQPTGAFGEIANSPDLVPALDGSFYAVMGTSPNALSIVKVGLTGNITNVHTFSGSEGEPVLGATLLRDKSGNFYGINTLPNNGSPNCWVYKLTPQGQFTVLATFPVLGIGPSPPLVLAPDGTIYGATYAQGPDQAGQIFKIPPGGPLTILVSFAGHGMFAPTSLFMADDGNLYGTTHSAISYFFRVVLPSGKLEKIYEDAGAGAACTCPMLQGSDGKFYGVSVNGGSTGGGTVFSLDAGLPPPKPRISELSPSTGAVGAKVLLWGTNFLGATSVTFNGTPATYIKIPTWQSVFVEVPAGATTGPITITTPNGSFTTATDFTVE